MLAVILTAATSADVLISNLAEPIRASSAIGGAANSIAPGFDNDAWYWAGQSFVTDGGRYSLLFIEAMAGELVGAPVLWAELRADDAGAPGGLISTLSVPDLTGTFAPRAFFPDSAAVLSANTAYWLLLRAESPGDGGFYWSYAQTNDTVGAGALAGYAFSSDSGASWSLGSDFPWMIGVNVEPAPCLGDLDADLDVDLADLSVQLAHYGLASGAAYADGDLDGDGDVDLADLAVMLSVFGAPCA